MNRDALLDQTDAQLLAQCEVDTYRASGPGGQKRNKTSSAVRLRHTPSDLLVIAEESRSQHENKAKALRRLRQALALYLRESISKEELAEGDYGAKATFDNAVGKNGRLSVGKRDVRFWPIVGIVLDVFVAAEAQVGTTARALGLTTGNLIAFLQTSPKLWEQVNHLRGEFGQKPLRMS